MSAGSDARADELTVVKPPGAGDHSFLEPVACAWRHRELILQLVKGDVVERHRGALLGFFWTVVQPVLYLSMFTFVFAVLRPGRRGAAFAEMFDHSWGFVLPIFTGLIVFWLASECFTRGCELLRSEASFVKDVVFPLEILAWENVGRGLFYTGTRLCVFAVAALYLQGSIPWTAVLLPLVLVPYVGFLVAAGWILSSAGLFVRELREVVSVFTTVLLFSSGVFFPLDTLPEAWRPWMLANPITGTIEQARRVLLFGELPDFSLLALYTGAAAVALWAGYRWFQALRGRFLHVL